MTSEKAGQEYIELNLLKARIIQQYFNTTNIIEQAEWEEKYNNLQQKESEYAGVEFSEEQKNTVQRLDLIMGLYEQYLTSTNVIERAEWEEKLRNVLAHIDRQLK